MPPRHEKNQLFRNHFCHVGPGALENVDSQEMMGRGLESVDTSPTDTEPKTGHAWVPDGDARQIEVWRVEFKAEQNINRGWGPNEVGSSQPATASPSRDRS
jgi:hypothetical protein